MNQLPQIPTPLKQRSPLYLPDLNLNRDYSTSLKQKYDFNQPSFHTPQFEKGNKGASSQRELAQLINPHFQNQNQNKLAYQRLPSLNLNQVSSSPNIFLNPTYTKQKAIRSERSFNQIESIISHQNQVLNHMMDHINQDQHFRVMQDKRDLQDRLYAIESQKASLHNKLDSITMKYNRKESQKDDKESAKKKKDSAVTGFIYQMLLQEISEADKEEKKLKGGRAMHTEGDDPYLPRDFYAPKGKKTKRGDLRVNLLKSKARKSKTNDEAYYDDFSNSGGRDSSVPLSDYSNSGFDSIDESRMSVKKKKKTILKDSKRRK